MKPSEVLKAARQLITPREKWTQGEFARDAEGNLPIAWETGMVDYDNAVCYCGLGALEAVNHCLHDIEIVRFLIKTVNTPNFADFNDKADHESVLAAFDKAIALAESEGN